MDQRGHIVVSEQSVEIESQPVDTAYAPASHQVVRGRGVAPGDIVGTEEEFLAGKGTWTDAQGNIRAAVAGEQITDANRQVSVVPSNMPPDINEGTVIYARIDEMFESVAFVTVEAMASGPKPRVTILSGVIPVSEIKEAFVESIRQEMRVGDIVRAAVSKLTPFRLELTVKPQGMGVVKAYCSYDRQPMELKGGAVVCTVCGQRETRHLGEPYGDLGPMGDIKLIARPRGPRREGGFGGGRGGPRGGYGDRGPRREGGYGDRGPRRESGRFGGGRGGPRRDGGFGGRRPFRPGGSGGRGAGQARY
ncbi:Exosome complex component Csl4 [uncultured archaeon]|nr:Exosome complex component Csl4 [uncultured archaeon]